MVIVTFCWFLCLAQSSEQCQRVGLNACRSLLVRDYAGALVQLDALRSRQKDDQHSMMSPGCCAKQALLSAAAHSGLAGTKSMSEMAPDCVKALMACELAVALRPGCLREVCCLSSQQLVLVQHHTFQGLESGLTHHISWLGSTDDVCTICNNTIIHCVGLALVSEFVAHSSCIHIELSTHCMLTNMAAHCISQPCVLCLSQAFFVKSPLLDMLEAFPAKLDLLNSLLLDDSALTAEEKSMMEQMKVMTAQQHAACGGLLNYQLLFGLEKPVRWNSVEKLAIGFHEVSKVCLCCAVLCCAVLCCAVLCCLTCIYNDCQSMCICHPDIVWCSSATLLLPTRLSIITNSFVVPA